MVVGAVVFGVLTLTNGGDDAAEVCVSETTGKSVDCDQAIAVSPEEYAAKKAKEKAAEERAAAAVADCRQKLGPFVDRLESIDSRLSVGMTESVYSSQVGNARVAYDQVPFKRLKIDCLTAGLSAEKAMNDYAKAADAWNNCLTDFSCDVDSIDPQLQSKWNAAGAAIDETKQSIRDIGNAPDI